MTGWVTVRALAPGDDVEIERLFDATVLLGVGLERVPAAFDHYRRLSLGWYLGPGRADAAVAVDPSGTVVGYTLVCVDEAAASRYATTMAVRLGRHVAAAVLSGHLDRASRDFYWARTRDAGVLLAARRSPPAPVHAHLNVRQGARTLTVSRALVDHVDRRCRVAGHDVWYGEMNEREGTRRRALERLGGEVVHTAPNHTFTRLLGEPVQRLTLVRRLSTAAE